MLQTNHNLISDFLSLNIKTLITFDEEIETD